MHFGYLEGIIRYIERHLDTARCSELSEALMNMNVHLHLLPDIYCQGFIQDFMLGGEGIFPLSISCIYNLLVHIRESVDSLCRDGSGPPIVCVHWKAVLTCERSCSKPF